MIVKRLADCVRRARSTALHTVSVVILPYPRLRWLCLILFDFAGHLAGASLATGFPFTGGNSMFDAARVRIRACFVLAWAGARQPDRRNRICTSVRAVRFPDYFFVDFPSEAILLLWTQSLKRLCQVIPHVFQCSLRQLTHAFAAACASGQCGCERCQPSQPGFKHSTWMSSYAVFIGFSAKSIASALVASHARSVPLDRRKRFCEFIARFPFLAAICDPSCLASVAFDFCTARKRGRSYCVSRDHTGRIGEILGPSCGLARHNRLQKARC